MTWWKIILETPDVQNSHQSISCGYMHNYGNIIFSFKHHKATQLSVQLVKKSVFKRIVLPPLVSSAADRGITLLEKNMDWFNNTYIK